jgi:hypothetical protein
MVPTSWPQSRGTPPPPARVPKRLTIKRRNRRDISPARLKKCAAARSPDQTVPGARPRNRARRSTAVMASWGGRQTVPAADVASSTMETTWPAGTATAPVGHTRTQARHPTHRSGSTTNFKRSPLWGQRDESPRMLTRLPDTVKN